MLGKLRLEPDAVMGLDLSGDRERALRRAEHVALAERLFADDRREPVQRRDIARVRQLLHLRLDRREHPSPFDNKIDFVTVAGAPEPQRRRYGLAFKQRAENLVEGIGLPDRPGERRSYEIVLRANAQQVNKKPRVAEIHLG